MKRPETVNAKTSSTETVRMQKDRELKNGLNLQMYYSFGLVIVTKVSQALECNEILLIGVIGYLIISLINIKKVDEIKSRTGKKPEKR